MQCPNCQTLNREHARFCMNCGYFLAALCPQCRRELPDNAKFCDSCGFSLTGQAPAASPLIPQPRTQSFPTQERINESLSPAPPLPPRALAGVPDISEPPDRAPVPAAPPPPVATSVEARLQQYIPKELLKKLNAALAGGGLIGERRVVTMLFCDVKGSTAAAEQLDPEDWTDIINGAFEHMIKPVYKYEGTVARLMGDAILAFFGAPIAHEDDPERAVLAGLDIVNGIKPYCDQVKARYGVPVDVRVGINTGMVVVGTVGSDLRMEYTAMGDAINLAARMEQSAQPGTVQIAHDTYKLVAPLFEVQELGEIVIKGKQEPVLAYRVLARKAEPGRMRGVAGLESRLVGRALEMATLDETLDKAEHGVGHIVGLISEAGLGKTRLIEEIQKKWKSRTALTWFAVGSLSYESSHAYGMFQNLVRQLNGITLDDSDAESAHQLEPMLARFAPEHRERVAYVLERLLGVRGIVAKPDSSTIPLEGEAFQRELYAVIQTIFRQTFENKPGVLVLDDLHWSDAASVELLRSLLPLTDELPLVVLFAIRPNRDAPGWQIPEYADRELAHHYTELKLRPLSDDDSRLLVTTLLGGAEIPADLMTKILERVVGNPFFIEEVVRTLIENGTFVRNLASGRWQVTKRSEGFDIPDSLYALLAARIDQLEEMTRRTLQLSAVIGRSFYVRVLAAIADPGHDLDRELGTLRRLDLIGEAARVPEIEYRFRNPLTQEVAYQSILLKQRRDFHRQVAEKMEELYHERLDEYASLLAHHFAASDHRDKAVHYARRAARRALGLYAYDDALRDLQGALDLVPAQAEPAVKAAVLEELADVYRLVRQFDQAISRYQQAHELIHDGEHASESHNEPDAVMTTRLHRKIVQTVTDAKWAVNAAMYEQVNLIRRTSLAKLEQELDAIAAKPPHAETVALFVALSMDAWRNQDPPDWETAQRFAQAAVDMAEQLDDAVVLSQALSALTSVLDGRSLLREHLAVALRRFEISRDPRMNDAHERIDALRGLGMAQAAVGEYQAALPHLAEAEAVAARMQLVDQQVNALTIQSQCLFRLDRWEQVLALEDKWRALERNYARERVGETCYMVALCASIHATQGQAERARRYAQESYDRMVSMSGQPEQWQRNQFY